MNNNTNADTALFDVAKQFHELCLLAASSAKDEENLKFAIEKALESACLSLSIPMQQHRFEIKLKNELNNTLSADSIHGAVIIEYEPPRSFSKGNARAVVSHAQQQASGYAKLMTIKEGRSIDNYYPIVFDGETICFGHFSKTDDCNWEQSQPFTHHTAQRFLTLLKEQGKPLVSPQLLRIELGIGSYPGKKLLPLFFYAIKQSSINNELNKSKTFLLFTEWSRLFGQAVGVQSNQLQATLQDISLLHGVKYHDNVPAYLFALHTYLALIAKLVAAMALPNASFQISNSNTHISQRIKMLESGELYANYNIINMLSGDFFSWYCDDSNWSKFENHISDIISLLSGISFDLSQMSPESLRDLFKGLYQEIIPKGLRHSLGEIYTPDWLASLAFDKISWDHKDDILDPACGTGTFLIEALKRRLQSDTNYKSANEILNGIYGIDINPLAILASKASLVLLISHLLPGHEKIHLPIFLADSINQTETEKNYYSHTIQTELKNITFCLPKKLVHSDNLFLFFESLQIYIEEWKDSKKVYNYLQEKFGLDLVPKGGINKQHITETIESLLFLRNKQWDSIWCSILADRFAVCAISNVSHIIGNPPWVKWSNLPKGYARFIKPLCKEMNLFSDAKYSGGIESDISIIFTYKSIYKWLKQNGILAFFITGTVFSDESSQGFRKFNDKEGNPLCSVISVDDFQNIKPFEGVSNHPTLLVLKKGTASSYPVPYTKWHKDNSNDLRTEQNPLLFQDFTQEHLAATPIPGKSGGPWLKGKQQELLEWTRIFDASQEKSYEARKGITTDLNGVYFINIITKDKNECLIENDPLLGKGINRTIPQVKRLIESDHIFPLLRGRHITPFVANIPTNSYVLLPQRGMHGDPNLPRTHGKTFSYLKIFKDRLEARGSYRKYQSDHPYWSVWSTGPYSFNKYKVAWREMSSKSFFAACISPIKDPELGELIVIPDHKVYFISTDDAMEAYYLTGILNSPIVSSAISSYAAQLSFGTSLCKYVKLQKFCSSEKAHLSIAEISYDMITNNLKFTDKIKKELNNIVLKLF